MDGKYITLLEAKSQCLVDIEYTGDDQFISDLIKDVESITESELCVPLSEIEQRGEFPRALKRGMLLLVGSYYRNREDEIANNESTPQQQGYRRMISLFRNYAG